MDRLKFILITGFGSGLAPFATGTWGSLVAVIIYGGLTLAMLGGVMPRGALEVTTGLLALAAAVCGIAWGEWAVRRFNSDDPKPFTLDELAGQWVALLFLPVSTAAGVWPFVVLAAGQFFLFRLFDVTKIPPAKQAEDLPAGWGITLDDIVAGIYANIAGQLIWRLTPLAAILFGHPIQ